MTDAAGAGGPQDREGEGEAPPIAHDTAFVPRHGEAVPVAGGVLRITAPNPGPFTFHGTNTYLVGPAEAGRPGPVVVVDPGPDDDSHLAAILGALGKAPVAAVLLTHRHRDHTALVPRLLARTARPPLLAAAPSVSDAAPGLDAAADRALAADRILADGEAVAEGARTIRAVATPGHAGDHLAFDLGEGVLLSGDHVMGWSTSVVAPPDGSMRDYMASLDRLIGRGDRLLLPGHGGAVAGPGAYLRALRAHRRLREAAILKRLAAGDRTIPEIVAVLYRSTDPRLHPAAGLSVLAHLLDLAERGLVKADGPPDLGARFSPA